MQFFYKVEKYGKIISFLIDHAKNFGISHYYVIFNQSLFRYSDEIPVPGNA
jgi:hypothetical protein